VPIYARVMFGMMNWAARKGLRDDLSPETPDSAKQRARRTGIRGETFAYWYLRRHGYVMIARNFTCRGMKGEIDLVGYDGETVAFVEVKTRNAGGGDFGVPEDAVTHDKQRHLARVSRQFLRDYRVQNAPVRFDIVAIETQSGRRPVVRLHKGAFSG
jgi:putative endonuclease